MTSGMGSRYIQRSRVTFGMGVDNRGVTVFLGNTGNPSISNREVTGDPSFTAFRVIVSVETLQILSGHFTGPICLPLTKVDAANGPTQ